MAEHPSTSTRTGPAYRVEVRATNRPFAIGPDQIIGTEWQPLPEVRVPHGIGVPDDTEHALTNTHSYYAAFALAAWFMAMHEWRATARIVEYRQEITTKLERREGREVGLDDAIVRMVRDADPTGTAP